MSKDIQLYLRQSAYAELIQFDSLQDDTSYIEVTEWVDKEGFDVEVVGKHTDRFQMTYGTFKALKKLVKKVENAL
jgi:predicted oxidoreductase